MKLLNCLSCHDIVKLQMEPRKCACGKSAGWYLSDGLNAVFTGPARILGIANPDYAASLKDQRSLEPPSRRWWAIGERRADCHVRKLRRGERPTTR